ncbi:hypothetical protein RRG08_052736 [Elysia crispata]|uniref:Uncharacterized protein n=1 Tax=Elysia crispata TaxID=231223 RepID=A0AAE1B6W8_9GAST|nr:hypothetical protein RRG08_052736 [Elysia crispata]
MGATTEHVRLAKAMDSSATYTEKQTEEKEKSKAIPRSLNTHRANLARGIKGYHEVSYEGGTDLQSRLLDCPKYKDHSCFIPLQKFTKFHLPQGYRDNDIVNFVQAQGELTVRVVSTITSNARPDGYAFHDFKGQGRPRYGTGFIQYLYRDDTRSHKPCPCPECKASGNPRKKWYKIKVRTATHVVFNKEESLGTHVELYFDGSQ